MDYDKEGFSFYEGDWVNNIRHGWGTRQYPSGNIYQGMWYNNIRHGDGTMRWLDSDQMYVGQWKKGIQVGNTDVTCNVSVDTIIFYITEIVIFYVSF